MNIKLAFLNGFLEGEVYIEQPMSYEVKGHVDKVLKFEQSLVCIEASSKNLV
jgi:hypothetical protein